jgi:hypothetical protein
LAIADLYFFKGGEHKRKVKEWERIRGKGEWHFIIKHGVLWWGLATVVLFSFVMSFMPWEASFLSILKESLVVFSLGSIVWGAFMCFVVEKSYRKHVSPRVSSAFRSLKNGMGILIPLILGLNFLIPNAFPFDEKPKSTGGEIEELVLTPEQMKKYAASYKDHYVLHIRKVINHYLSGKLVGGDNYKDLKAIDQEYLKSKFVVLSINNSLMGGRDISIISQKKPDKIFKVWVYGNAGAYELRAFDVEELSKEEIRKIKIMFKRYLHDKELAL